MVQNYIDLTALKAAIVNLTPKSVILARSIGLHVQKVSRSLNSRRAYWLHGGVIWQCLVHGWLCKTKYVNELPGVGVNTFKDDDCRWSATHFLPRSTMG